MSKILIFLAAGFAISLFIVIAILVHPILANHTIDDSVISITHSPIPVKTDSGSITFTITATRDIFDTNQDYWFNTWRVDGTNKDRCIDIIEPITTDNPKKFVVTSTIRGCTAEIGQWKFELWLGRGTVSRSDSSLIIKDYNFAIEQAGGSIPQIIPVKTPLGLSETPQVTLINARSGNTYEFWWDGSKKDFAATKYKPISNGNISNINLDKVGVDFSQPGQKKLCMEVGNDPTPTGVTCRFATVFEFTATRPPPQNQLRCTVLPPKPSINDDVSLKAENLPPDTNFSAEWIDSQGQVANFYYSTVNSGKNGVVDIGLGKKLSGGDYTVSLYKAEDIYKSDKQAICKQSFNVSGQPSGGEGIIPQPCKPGDKDCTSSGDKDKVLCGDDPNNPGIRTAIGCIRTSPVGFIKDSLKFIIGISGGLAFLMMLLGAFQMVTSAGNPETLQAGRDRFQSAIIGLLFVIFAVLLLQIIGVGILDIPGFKP